MAASSQYPYYPYQYPSQTRERPLGVTILAILEAIGGLLSLVGGIWLFNAAKMFPLLIFFVPFAIFSIIIGIIALIVAWGLWSGKGWAWTIALILSVIGIVLGIVSIASGGIIAIIINGIILYYLTRPHVKAFFGKQ